MQLIVNISVFDREAQHPRNTIYTIVQNFPVEEIPSIGEEIDLDSLFKGGIGLSVMVTKKKVFRNPMMLGILRVVVRAKLTTSPSSNLFLQKLVAEHGWHEGAYMTD